MFKIAEKVYTTNYRKNMVKYRNLLNLKIFVKKYAKITNVYRPLTQI